VSCNRLELSGEVAEIVALRYTPAGIPVLGFTLCHGSQQSEAGLTRKVDCEVSAVVMGPLAERTKGLSAGSTVKVSGFLARRSLKSTQLVLHINELEII